MSNSIDSIPSISADEVAASIVKSRVIQIRVTPLEKETIQQSASRAKLTVTDYLVRCALLVGDKLPPKTTT